ncbi:peptide MFS transporter [uncultured Paludibaculum sp.]|uniref:peptide MFS transporter n=1 Tax=uncultured Paludibaculum sp. TaxID=1765020 RepID=UPI002AAC331F|nr:peptide MFS transporter [uncultured Paludibaculum sp.]
MNQDTRFFGHPAGLSTLFFTELWERFGYYGMRALLVLFMTAAASAGGMGLDTTKAYAIYGLYTASVYGFSLPGGWIADRILGQRRTVMYGGFLIAAGYLMLAVPSESVFYLGLPVIVFGTGMLKPNISTIVGQIYAVGDTRRDSGFSIFYMGINIGATVSPLICGYVGERINWHYGFGLAGVGMLFGVLTFWMGRHRLGDAGLHPVKPPTPEEGLKWHRQFRLSVLGLVGAAAVLAGLHLSGIMELTAERLVDAAGVLLVVITLGLFGWMFFGGDWTAAERKRLIVIMVFFCGSALYWAAFEQAGSSFSVFAKRNTDLTLFGFDFPASWFQSLNAGFIICFAAAFAWLWLKMGDRQPSSVMKFALSLFFATGTFLVMMAAAQRAGVDGRVSPLWLVATYLLQTFGELLLSPVGLSAMTKLAPERVAGLMMGVWFLSLSMGNYLAGKMASIYGNLPPFELFRTLGIIMVVAAVILTVIARPVSKLTGDVK